MEWSEMSVETLGRRLGGYLKHKRWYKTSIIGDDFYPFFAACWQHKTLRMEILHRIDDWGPARYQTFIECIEAHLPKKAELEYKLVPGSMKTIDDPAGERTSCSAGPGSSVYWEEKPMVYGPFPTGNPDRPNETMAFYSSDQPMVFNSIKEWEESPNPGAFSLLRSEPTVKWKAHEASVADTALYEAFIEECCEKGQGYEVRCDTELEPAYREWRIANSDRFPIVKWDDSVCSDLRNWLWNHYSGTGYSGRGNNDGYTMFYGIRLKDGTVRKFREYLKSVNREVPGPDGDSVDDESSYTSIDESADASLLDAYRHGEISAKTLIEAGAVLTRDQAMKRWHAHPASGGGEVPIENSSQSAVEMADDYNILTLDDETKKWWLTFHTHNPEFPGERITVAGDTETEARIAMERWRGDNQDRITGEILDPLSDMPYISADERLKLLQRRWIDKHGPSKGCIDKKYDFSTFVDPHTGEIDPEFLDDDARLKYQQCEWIEENGPVRDVDMIYRMERETIGAMCENMEEQEEPQENEYAARIEGDSVFTFLGLDHGTAKADGEPTDDGITTINDDVSGGCVSLSGEPVMGRRFESDSGRFPSIYLEFINTYYVRDDAYQVTFASIWKLFGSRAIRHPSKKVMGQFLMSIGLERTHDTANMTIYHGIRPKKRKE